MKTRSVIKFVAAGSLAVDGQIHQGTGQKTIHCLLLAEDFPDPQLRSLRQEFRYAFAFFGRLTRTRSRSPSSIVIVTFFMACSIEHKNTNLV